MKNILLSILLLVVLFSIGCKRQDIKPNNNDQENTIETVSFSDEPSIRVDSESEEELKTVYFAFDKSELTQDSLETLKENAAYLMRNNRSNVVVEGHTDNRGTIEYNLSLGQRRALKVKEYYVQLGILPNRIATISYGKEKPVDLENNEVSWLRNRRAVTKVLESKR
ncbi:MAG: OmpA family protein [Endomicrobium sp.]|jgi:peptidoglycan-associated lipoprotein|uniref:OmpA family protein n=1 Tax=Candidatus Endomicrobiellum cubanum TaxID=3242325 RepID=UPI002836B7CA|nr:OmpA family protein [Endomicrobium sp.]